MTTQTLFSDTAPLTVSHVCTLLEELVSAPGLLTIEGEVSGLVQSRAGHSYFTLKDASAALRCVLFAGAAKRSGSSVIEGSKVTLSARASLYAKTGALQLIVETINAPQAQGELYAQFIRLKETLTKKGIFDDKHKRPIPEFPETIGVITSATGAVRRDIETTLARRFPCATVVLFAAQVQGDAAVMSLCRALDASEAYQPTLSCIIIGRGGGSLEDLAAFNSEQVVYRIHACQLPVISAVGHQTDTSLCDFVADMRAPTPTAAAELASPSQEELLLWLDEQQKNTQRVLKHRITEARHCCVRMETQLLQVHTYITHQQHRMALHLTSVQQKMHNRMQGAQAELMIAAEQLRARNPDALLERGFAYATTAAGQPVKSIAQLAPHDTLNLRVQDGNAAIKVLTTAPAHEPKT